MGALSALVAGSLLAGTVAASSATAAPVVDDSSSAPSTVTTSTSPTGSAEPTTIDAPGAVDALAGALAASVPLDVRASDPDITFIAGLTRNTKALDIRATKATDPAAIEFRDFMTLREAGLAYGSPAKNLDKLRAAAAQAKVAVRIDPSRILARFTAPASVWQRLYGVAPRVVEPTAGSPYRLYVIRKNKEIAGAPTAFAGLVSEWNSVYVEYVADADIAGIDPEQTAGLQATLASTGSPLAWPVNTGTIPANACGAPALKAKKVFAPAQIRQAYASTWLSSRGMRGAGTRMTIISIGGGFAQADLDAAAECFRYRQPPVVIARGVGVAKPFVNASIETHLDLMTASSVVSQAESIRLVQAVNAPIGFTDALSLALNIDGKGEQSPDVVSLSYGICEAAFAADLGSYLTLNEDIFRMAALVGTTMVVAAGDNGSSMCGAEAALENGPSVWYPASSPWVTAVGGTRLALTSTNAREAEIVWNDFAFAGAEAAPPPLPAGAGGPSALFTRPWYQGGVTPVGPRAVPDVSLLGAIRPGWPLTYGGQLFSVGGTSGGAPFLGANLALMAAQQRATGYPTFGFVNPWFYKAAAATPSPFYDVTVGSNGVQLIGCCSAYAGYDMASGLGVPAMDALYRSIPFPAG